ncbi:MAG: methyltransferase domain-containing protein [bacterium]|nr:methyltransferase domain-containing protein [bacterium]
METGRLTDTNRKIQSFFDRHAETWDETVACKFPDRVAALVADLDIVPGDRVLDVGAGTGVLFPLLGPRVGEDGLIAAIDLSSEMCARANAKTAQCRIECVQTDVMALGFAAGSFDWVICFSVFPHFADQGRGLAELARALRPGGRIAVCHSQSREAINEHHEHVGEIVGGHTIPETGVMRTLVADAGLELLRLDESPERYLMVARKPA